MSKFNIQNSHIGIVGDHAQVGNMYLNGKPLVDTDYEQLHAEFEQLISHLQRTPKNDKQVNEFEKLKEAAAAAQHKQPGKLQQVMKFLGNFTLDAAKQVGTKLILELLKG